MRRAPRIGDRVRFTGSLAVGPCEGTVERIYPQHAWDEDRQREGQLLPESEWHVRVRPDTLPELWPYVNTEVFAADVRRLTLLQGAGDGM